MMHRSKVILSILILALMIPSGCKESVSQYTSLDNLMAVINYSHESIQKPDVDFAIYSECFAENDFSFTPSLENGHYDANLALSLSQAEEDIEYLFTVLSDSYGAYFHFGGEEAFSAAKKTILEDLRTSEYLTCGTMEATIMNDLSFIHDQHFLINYSTLHSPVLAYMYTGVPFLKSETGFYNSLTGQIVKSADGFDDLSALFQLSIAKGGKIVYYPIILSAETPGALTIKYADGSSQTLLTSTREYKYIRRDACELIYKQNIPIIADGSMGFDHAQGNENGKQFIQYAEELKDAPVLIIDLRSNAGGNAILPLKWFSLFAGKQVPTNYISIGRLSKETLMQQDMTSAFYVPYEEICDIGGWEPISSDCMKAYTQPDTFIKNDRLLVLLTSKNTGSAAEMFVDIAHNMENTLIVGENTSGTLISGSAFNAILPNSSISVIFGNIISIFPDGYFEEYVGLKPDLWVNGDALQLTLKLIANYR